MEADSRQVKEMIQPILDTEDGLMKVRQRILEKGVQSPGNTDPFVSLAGYIQEVEGFLREQDVLKLRRRELQHMQWTKHVLLPLQKRVDEYMSKNGAAIIKKRQRLHSHYLQLCKTKVILAHSHWVPVPFHPLPQPLRSHLFSLYPRQQGL